MKNSNPRRIPLLRWLPALALPSYIFVACFNPTVNEGVTCGVNDSCPSGMQCDPTDMTCRFDLRDGSGPTNDGGDTDASYDANVPPPDNAQLASLVPSVGTLEPTFDPATTNYINLLGLVPTSLTLTPTASVASATITVDDNATVSGEASVPLPLLYGPNMHPVEVKDGGEVGNYLVQTRRGPGIAQETYFKAPNSDQDDQYGRSIDIDGNTMVIAASNKGNDNAGYVYVYDYTPDGGWAFTTELVGSNTESLDQFGSSVAIHGDLIVVGAVGEKSASAVDQDNNDTSAVGAAYVFRRETGVWNQKAYLKPTVFVLSHLFGRSVDVYDSTIVVGATDVIADSQKVYVFTSADAGLTWTLAQTIPSVDRDEFGADIALHADTLVVGAIEEDSNGSGIDPADNDLANNTGAVYVYKRTGDTFAQQAYIKASNPGGGERFGISVAISGDSMVVGADRENGGDVGINGNELLNGTPQAGAAYVFFRTGTTWEQQAYVKASNTGTTDRFGTSVAIDGNVMVIGAWGESGTDCTGANQADNAGLNTGAAYVFGRNGSTWQQLKYLKALNCEEDDWFGFNVATAGGVVVVAAELEDGGSNGIDGTPNNNQTAAGAVYTFR